MWLRRPRVGDLEPGDRCRLRRRGHLWTVHDTYQWRKDSRLWLVMTRPPEPGDPDPEPLQFTTLLPPSHRIHDHTPAGVRA